MNAIEFSKDSNVMYFDIIPIPGHARVCLVKAGHPSHLDYIGVAHKPHTGFASLGSMGHLDRANGFFDFCLRQTHLNTPILDNEGFPSCQPSEAGC